MEPFVESWSQYLFLKCLALLEPACLGPTKMKLLTAILWGFKTFGGAVSCVLAYDNLVVKSPFGYNDDWSDAFSMKNTQWISAKQKYGYLAYIAYLAMFIFYIVLNTCARFLIVYLAAMFAICRTPRNYSILNNMLLVLIFQFLPQFMFLLIQFFWKLGFKTTVRVMLQYPGLIFAPTVSGAFVYGPVHHESSFRISCGMKCTPRCSQFEADSNLMSLGCSFSWKQGSGIRLDPKLMLINYIIVMVANVFFYFLCYLAKDQTLEACIYIFSHPTYH